MKQTFNILFLLALCTSLFTFVSCKETEVANNYDNWDVRNQMYIDSIARECETNTDGKWVRFCAYNRDEDVEIANNNKNHFVYVHKNVEGTGSYHPQYNDGVRVHYLGRLIPSELYSNGYIFKKSYNGYTLNEKTDVPELLTINTKTVGIITTLMQMVEGDDWTVYIPYELAYGEDDYDNIHGCSTIICDLKLAKVYKYGIDTNTAWY